MPADRSAAGSGSIARLLARDTPKRGFFDLARDLLAPVPGWIAQEVEHRRLFLWLPVAIGLGVVLYFAAEAEPSWIAPLVGTGVFGAAALWLRNLRRLAFTAAVGMACVFAGFAAGSLRTWLVAAPVLDRPRVLRLTAFVESIDRRVEG